jgi:uncharacterized OsmC-like protein
VDAIRDAIAGASAYLTAHPGEAEYTDSQATAVLGQGLRVAVTGPNGETISTDMPTSVGGEASAPSAGWLLRAAEAACAATLIAMRAATQGVRLTRLAVTVDSRSDDRGILGLDAAIPAGPLSGRIAVEIEADGASNVEVDAIVRWAIDHCPVLDALRRTIPVDVAILR